MQISTIDADGQKSEGSVVPGSGTRADVNVDLSGDPTGCIRGIELFTNTYTTGGWSSTTYNWVSGLTTTDSNGAVT